MATIDELVIELSADTKALQAELKSAVAEMKKSTDLMAKSTEDLAKRGSQGTSFLERAYATMAGFISGEAIIGAFKAVKDAVFDLADAMITEGIKGASEQQDAMQGFMSTLAQTGRLTKDAASSFENFAGKLQESSKFTDDQAISAGKLLANLTNLKEQGLEDATQAAANLAQAMGLDLNQAATLVGKAINGQGEALKRYGIQVREGSTESENFANVLRALNDRGFSGSAISATKTYSGAIDQVKKQWGESTEAIGNVIIHNQTLLNVIGAVGEVLKGFTSGINGNKSALNTFVSETVVLAINSLAILVSTMEAVSEASMVLTRSITLQIDRFNLFSEVLNNVLQGDFGTAVAAYESGSDRIDAANAKAFAKPEGFEKILDSLADIKGAAIAGFGQMKIGADAAVEPINNAAAATKQLSEEQKLALKNATDFSIGLAQQADTQQEIYALELEMLDAQHEAKLVSDSEYYAQKEALLAQNIENEQNQLNAAIASGSISDTQARQAQVALTAKTNAEIIKQTAQRNKSEEEQNKQRAQNFSDTIGYISTLSSSGNKTLAAIGKTAAITQATIDGYAAVQKAFASAPPPYNFALAALVGTATAANVAKIAGVPLATGIDEVPGVGTKDNFPAILAPGERVVPSNTNEDLKAFLEDQRSAPRNNINVSIVMNDIFTSDPREMGLKIVDTINEAVQAHGVKILGSTIS